MDETLIAMIRKLLSMGLFYVAYLLFDKYELRGFQTRELLKSDPKAIAMLLGLLAIAIALC